MIAQTKLLTSLITLLLVAGCAQQNPTPDTADPTAAPAADEGAVVDAQAPPATDGPTSLTVTNLRNQDGWQSASISVSINGEMISESSITEQRYVIEPGNGEIVITDASATNDEETIQFVDTPGLPAVFEPGMNYHFAVVGVADDKSTMTIHVAADDVKITEINLARLLAEGEEAVEAVEAVETPVAE
ncbi:hypothetical protein OAS86_02460 [Gammaproteobacteria bacterium]|nr:hypothetical protein [Gammaproteobacteria bacterium]